MVQKTLFLRIVALCAVALGNPVTSIAGQVPPDGARVFFENLGDGDTVRSPFLVKFGAEGVRPVPIAIKLPGTGHHHLIINTDLGDSDKGFAIPDDQRHRHFIAGQTEVTLNLQPGRYSLRLVFADSDHVPYDPWLRSEKIFITVEE